MARVTTSTVAPCSRKRQLHSPAIVAIGMQRPRQPGSTCQVRALGADERRRSAALNISFDRRPNIVAQSRHRIAFVLD